MEMIPDESIPAHECWPCFVGSGECKRPAIFKIDDGQGAGAYICAEHKAEFDAMLNWLSGSPERFAALQKAVDEHE